MPRARKKGKSQEEKANEKALNRMLALFWHERIEAGKKQKEDYCETGREVLDFFRAKHDHLYEKSEDFMSFEGSATVSVPKVAQMKNSLGPRLYVAAPSRTLTPRSKDGVMVALTRTLSAYLTYTAKEAKFAKTIRAAVDDGLLFGRMVLRQVWDDIRKIIAAEHLDSDDLIFDPDFTKIEDASWIAIRHREPLWKMKRRLPKWRLRGIDRHAYSGGIIGLGRQNEDTDPETEEENTNTTATMVEWWEILSKMGCGLRGAGMDKKDAKRFEKHDKEDFVRLAVVLGHPILLEQGDWDVPLYLDREWPISFQDLVETPRSSWPESPIGQVLSLQKAADLLTSLRLSSCKNRDRVVVFCDKKVAGEAQEQLRHGSAADFIPLSIPTGYSLDSVMKVADFGQGAVESANEREFLLSEMEVTLGTTPNVTGGQDQQAADRSATASQMRASASEVRTADLENKVAELLTDSARKEAIMARLFLDEEDVTPYVNASEIQMFFVEVTLPGQAVIPVRPPSMGDSEDSFDKPITLVDIYPPAATYFETPVAVGEAIMGVWNALANERIDPRLIQIRDTLVAMGMDEMTGLPTGIKLGIVTADRVWQDTAGLTAEELMREFAYTVEAGRGVKFDKAAQRDNITNLMQTMMPVLTAAGDFDGMNKLMTLRYQAFEVPRDQWVMFNPPQMPQGQEQGKPEGSGPPKEEK